MIPSSGVYSGKNLKVLVFELWNKLPWSNRFSVSRPDYLVKFHVLEWTIEGGSHVFFEGEFVEGAPKSDGSVEFSVEDVLSIDCHVGSETIGELVGQISLLLARSEVCCVHQSLSGLISDPGSVLLDEDGRCVTYHA